MSGQERLKGNSLQASFPSKAKPPYVLSSGVARKEMLCGHKMGTGVNIFR